MSEPRHRQLPGAADAADRESRTEALLVEGLDHYFRGSFDEAVHLWTRVLFIDRTHARARAYINRARTAQGERLRRADEMLHMAGTLLDNGDLDQARQLLANAEQASGADEKVAELWARVERVERTRRSAVPLAASAIVDARPLPSWRRTTRLVVQAVAAVAFGLLLATVLASPVVSEWWAGESSGNSPIASTGRHPLSVLTSEDVALVRARQLYGRGRLSEALAVLERLDATGGNREAIDQLRVEIQRWLLMSRPGAVGAVEAPGEAPR